MCDPAPHDPQDAQVAKHYIADKPGFESTARKWTEMYAQSTSNAGQLMEELGLDQAAIARLLEMGFERKTIVKALKKCDGDENRAIEAIFSADIQ